MRKLSYYADKQDKRLISCFVLQMPMSLFKCKEIKDMGLNTRRVIFSAPFSSPGGFWVKVEPEHAKKMGWDKNRIFPISYLPANIVLKWPVIKILEP